MSQYLAGSESGMKRLAPLPEPEAAKLDRVVDKRLVVDCNLVLAG